MSQTELYTSLFKVALDRHALEMNAHVDLEGLLSDADLEVRFDCIARMFLVHMRAYAAAKNYRDQRKISIRVPASWWQHLKRDYAPEWFTRWWPVRMKKRTHHFTTKVTNLCPHAYISWDQGKAKHLEFMMRENDKELFIGLN
jgi:hypothetical protein